MTDPKALIAVGALLLAVVVVADRALSAHTLSAEWPPATGLGYLVRSLGLALAAVALVIGGRHLAEDLLVAAPNRPANGLEVGAAALGGAVGVATAVLLLVDPSALFDLVREDGPIEWASAVLWFVAGGLYAAAAIGQLRGRGGPAPTATAMLLMAASATALLLGLEEISWFQRVLDVESPEFMLNRNGQQELNLHNLATGITGNAFFVGAFLFCNAIPYLVGDRLLPRSVAGMQPLLPSRAVFVATATSTAVVYQMWNILWIQVMFWMALAMAVTLGSSRRDRLFGGALAAVMVFVALVYLSTGDSMVRSWDDTEVREMIIPIGLVIAGAEAVRAIRRHPDP